MKIIGIDLAGNPKNDTGFCILNVENETGEKSVTTRILHSNSEIIKKIIQIKPELIAIDAPLIFSGKQRECDNKLRKYGALPVTLKGMEVLAVRGAGLADELEQMHLNFIEVFSTASAKILGLHKSRGTLIQKELINMGLKGDTEKRMLSKDELDAIFAAITGYLYLIGQSESIGDENGKIIVPKV